MKFVNQDIHSLELQVSYIKDYALRLGSPPVKLEGNNSKAINKTQV